MEKGIELLFFGHFRTLQRDMVSFEVPRSVVLEMMKFYERDTIEASVADVVHVLKSTPSLSKTQIGDYLGGDKPRNIAVMRTFIDSFDFTALNLDDGIRKL